MPLAKCNVSKVAINRIIKNIKKLYSNEIEKWFFRYSLNWIKNRANVLLNQRTNGFKSSRAREWTITITNNVAKLENQDPNSGAIEFGIGIIGQLYKHKKAKNDPHIPASENGYQYNQESGYKDDNWGWTFQLPNGQYIYTQGYGGKSFLFDSLMEYISQKKYNEFYQKAFDRVMIERKRSK